MTQPRVAGSDQSVTNREVDLIDVERKYPMQPMNGKNLWRLTEFYGRLIGVPELKPHDLRHGVAMEVYGEHGDLEKVRALLGHQRIDATQI